MNGSKKKLLKEGRSMVLAIYGPTDVAVWTREYWSL